MSGLAFFEDVVIVGSVLGADSTCRPDEVTALLGADFVENSSPRQMWRDYGLIEFFWGRPSASSPWRGTHFTVQVHRLASGGADVTNENLALRYGAFEPRLSFEHLRAAVERRGFPLEEVPGASPGCVEYWQPESQASVLVSADADDIGRVLKISVPLTADVVAARRNRYKATSLSQALDQLVQASEQDRAKWLDRRQPTEPDLTNWWLQLLVLIGNRISHRAEQRSDWVLFCWWALSQASGQGALSQVETAIRKSYFIADLRCDGVIDAAVRTLLPSADDVVRTCLSLLPLSLSDVVEPPELNTLSLLAMRRSRQAKNLIAAAAPHLDHLHDVALATELRGWIALRLNLL